MGLHKFLTLLTIAMVILLGIAAWVFPSNQDFRVENPFWNGSSDTYDEFSVVPVRSLADLPASPQEATLVLIPSISCNATELKELSLFVIRGGTLVLADDFGYGNNILSRLGLETRFSGQPLLDPLLNYKNKNFPSISLMPDPLTDNISIIFNHATCLTGVNERHTLAQSSSFSFLDSNDDGTWQEGEPTGPLPVISRHAVGRGQVIAIADSSLFINSMLTIGGNKEFLRYISAGSENLYLDQAHLPQTELNRTKGLLADVRDFLKAPLVTGIIVIIILIILLKPIWLDRSRRSGGDALPADASSPPKDKSDKLS